MARRYAQIALDVWSDPDFRQLSHGAQWLYWLLISQPTMSAAGVLPLQERRWAKLAADTGRDDVEKLLAELDAARYVLVDEDTEEALVRSYLRNDGSWRLPNLAKTAFTQARQIVSARLRAAMVEELCRIPFGSLDGKRAEDTRQLARETIAALSPKGSAPTPPWDSRRDRPSHDGRDDVRDSSRDTAATHSASHEPDADQPMGDPKRLGHGVGAGVGEGATSVDGCSSLSERDERFAETITANSDARPDEIPAVLAHIRATHRPDSLAAWLRAVIARGDLGDVVEAARAAAARPAVDTRAPREKPKCPEHRLILPCTSCAADAKAGDAA
jgi:hypothetical protein